MELVTELPCLWVEAGLLSKCLKPEVSAQFRFLHEGKLFCLTNDQMPGQGGTVDGPLEVEYVWMCRACFGGLWRRTARQAR